jgi:hypothetical protein
VERLGKTGDSAVASPQSPLKGYDCSRNWGGTGRKTEFREGTAREVLALELPQSPLKGYDWETGDLGRRGVYGWVAEKFQPVSRLTELSFSHYQEAASLPADQARDLLGKAARENLSKAQVRREVQAIKAANDPSPAAAPEHQPAARTPPPSQSAKAELTAAYEMVIEFAEALEKERLLTKRERRLFAVAAGHRERGARRSPRLSRGSRRMMTGHGSSGRFSAHPTS